MCIWLFNVVYLELQAFARAEVAIGSCPDQEGVADGCWTSASRYVFPPLLEDLRHLPMNIYVYSLRFANRSKAIFPQHTATFTRIGHISTRRFNSNMAGKASLKRAEDFVTFLNASPTRKTSTMM